MLFPTFGFALFFVGVFAAHWMTLRHPGVRKMLLLVASYAFYAAWDWRFCLLLLLSSLVNFAAGAAIRGSEQEAKRKLALAVCIVANLSLLGFFKYYGFFIESLDSALTHLGWQRDLLFLDVVLPVGISFFTFQGISYAVDTYRRQIADAPSFIDVLLYISFFPQLVAGPIVRAAHFLPQLRAMPTVTAYTTFGLLMIVWGLFKKVVVATYLAQEIVEPVFFDPLAFGGVDVLFAIYGYTIQIYCDFSAYSDIAIGVAALLGFKFPRNFDQPYRAASLREFWRRWHISLSTWLRDYLYIPLGGARLGAWLTYRNLFLTMLLGGFWHGAAWQFIAWGAMHGSGLALERALRGLHIRWLGTLPQFVRVLLVFHFVCVGWVLFRAESLAVAVDVFQGLSNTDFKTMLLTPFVAAFVIFGLFMHFTPTTLLSQSERLLARCPSVVQGLAAGACIVLIDALGIDGVAPFIYFQF